MKLSENFLDMKRVKTDQFDDMKRVKTDQFDNMFAHSCLDMSIIKAQIRPYCF